MMQWIKAHRHIFATILPALALAAMVIVYESTMLEEELEPLRMASDGLFVSGIFFTGFGLLILVAHAGGFDALAFLAGSLRTVFSPRKNALSGRMTYMDYKLKKAADREEKGKPSARVVVTGAAFVAVSVVLACLV